MGGYIYLSPSIVLASSLGDRHAILVRLLADCAHPAKRPRTTTAGDPAHKRPRRRAGSGSGLRSHRELPLALATAHPRLLPAPNNGELAPNNGELLPLRGHLLH